MVHWTSEADRRYVSIAEFTLLGFRTDICLFSLDPANVAESRGIDITNPEVMAEKEGSY